MRRAFFVLALVLAVSAVSVGSASACCWGCCNYGWSCSWGYGHCAPYYATPCCSYSSCVSPYYSWPCGGPNCCYGSGYYRSVYHQTAMRAEIPTRGTVIVTLPEDARLIVEGKATKLMSGRRVFMTPKLDSAKEYRYTMTAEVVRDGKTHSVSQEVRVRAGRTETVSLQLPPVNVAAK